MTMIEGVDMKRYCLLLVMPLIASLLISAGCAQQATEGALSVKSIEVIKTYGGEPLHSGEIIQPGESINVEAVVKNISDASGSYKVELEVNGEVRDSRTAPLNAGDETTIIFTLSFDEEGGYELSILSKSVTVTVGAGVTPRGVKVGDEWTLSGNVKAIPPQYGETEFVQIMTCEVIEIEESFVTTKQAVTIKNMEGEVIHSEELDPIEQGTHILGMGPVVNTDWERNEREWMEEWDVSFPGWEGPTEFEHTKDVSRETKNLAGYQMEVVYFYSRQLIVNEAEGMDYILERTYGYSEEHGILVWLAMDMEGTMAGQEVDSETSLTLSELSLGG